MKESPAPSRVSSIFALSLGVLLPCASAQAGLILDFSSGAISTHVCGNGISGGAGSGKCDGGTLPDPSSIDMSTDAVSGNALKLSGPINVGFGLFNDRYGNVYGAYVRGNGDFTLQNNIVTVDVTGATGPRGHHIDGNVYAGSAEVSQGHLRITGNQINYLSGDTIALYGGYAVTYDGRAEAENNTVIASGGVVQGIEGGYTYSDTNTATTTNNHVYLYGNVRTDGGTFGGVASTNDVYTARAASNTVEIYENARVIDGAFGGEAWSYNGARAEAVGNRVSVYGNAMVRLSVYGGASTGFSSQSIAICNDNTVEISGNVVVWNDVVGGDAYASKGGEAIGNLVKISGGEVYETVTGGRTGTHLASAVIRENTVIISGGSIGQYGSGNIYGGSARNVGDEGEQVSVNDNTVVFSGNAKTTGSIHGGYVSPSNQAPVSVVFDIRDNAVTVRDQSRVAGSLYGGRAVFSAAGPAHVARITGNTVTVEGTPVFNAATGLYGGGCTHCTASSDLFTGNTLNFKSSGLRVASVQNFEFLNFYLPPGTQAGDTLLTVTGTAELGDGAGRSSTVTVDLMDMSLKPGESVILIDANSLIGTPSDSHTIQDTVLKYDFNILVTGNQLIATMTGVSASEESKSISEGYLAGNAFVNQGSDFLTSKGLQSAQKAVRVGLQAGQFRPQHFGTIGGGQVRHKTGSHVDVRGYNLVAGAAVGFRPEAGTATLSAFFEYGEGDYSTYNSFASGKVKGHGDTRYKGVGLIGRFDFSNALYVEGSFRGGKSEIDYRSDDLRDASGQRAQYETDSGYLGAHLSVGKLWELGERDTLDTYAQILWTHQGRDSVTLSTGERVKFESVDSERARIGAKISHTLVGPLSAYTGVAYEYEFASQAKATVNGYKIDTPKLQGSTGMLEVGLSLVPAAKQPFHLDLGVRGYAGKREGVMTNLRAEYRF